MTLKLLFASLIRTNLNQNSTLSIFVMQFYKILDNKQNINNSLVYIL